MKETESTVATFSTLRSMKQQIKTIELTKKFLSAFDDKRYIFIDGITILAYGDYKVAQMKSTLSPIDFALTFIFYVYLLKL